MSARVTQAEWDKKRAKVKAKAAKVVEANAKKAQDASDKARGIKRDKPKATPKTEAPDVSTEVVDEVESGPIEPPKGEDQE